jgi:hypothetical protein
MLVQPWIVPGGCKPFAVRSGGAFDESSGRRREGVREVEAACPPFVALCRDAVMVATRCAAVFLTAVAEGGVICVEVPAGRSSQYHQRGLRFQATESRECVLEGRVS